MNIGKAYSGLTDAEIAEMTKWFLDHTIEDQGFRRVVEPKIVLEVAFNNMMQSDRHESGYALRFPRIVRLRPDKSPEDADTIERAREIYDSNRITNLLAGVIPKACVFSSGPRACPEVQPKGISRAASAGLGQRQSRSCWVPSSRG